jgi:hypothetical protein
MTTEEFEREEGKLVYTDESGGQHRLPHLDERELTAAESRGATEALGAELGAPEPGYAKIVALERLNELRAAGLVSEENYAREKRRLSGLG